MSTSSIAEPVAITGVGVVSPFGIGVAPFFDALRSGASALAPDADLAAQLPRHEDDPKAAPLWCARVADTGARQIFPAARLRRVPRLGQLGLVAAHQALGATPPGADQPPAVVAHYGADRVGVVLGTGLGSFEQTMDFTLGYLHRGPEDASPAAFPLTVMNATAGMLAMEWQLRGLNITVNHRDLSLAEAVATARDQLVLGRADAIVAGGFEELGPWVAHCYRHLGALSPAPARPYDRRRDGMSLGEGAVMLQLERLADARRRGAEVIAVLAGVGRAGDDRPRLGYLRPGAPLALTGAVQAVQGALRQAQLSAADLRYVAGGGDGGALDRLETAALRQALGPAAAQVALSSPLGQTGECMVSAGFRVLSALYALRSGTCPGTGGCDDPDPADSLPGLRLRSGPLDHPGSAALVPVFAMGGGNVALVLAG